MIGTSVDEDPRSTFALRCALGVALLLSVGASWVFAEVGTGSDASSARSSPTTDAARRAGLEFLIGSDLTLSSFDGALISYRTEDAAGSGWRLGLDLAASIDKIETSTTQDDSTSRVESTNHPLRVGLIGQRTFSTRAANGLALCWGLGPEGGYSYTRLIEPYPGYSRSERAWVAGIAGSLGVDWLIGDRFSVLADYGATAEYSWSRIRDENPGPTFHVLKQRRFALSSRSVRFGLTAWFR